MFKNNTFTKMMLDDYVFLNCQELYRKTSIKYDIAFCKRFICS